jgi:hypothetical protein
MQSLFWLLVWLLFAGTNSPAGSPPAQAPSPAGSALTLDYGVTTEAAGGDLALTFTDVVEDSRCPADVACVWSGMAVVTLEVEAGGQAAQTVQLGGMTDSAGKVSGPVPARDVTDAATVGGYRVQLLAVTPYPTRAGALPALQNYQIQLLVHADDGG